jgi:hypothetical protein
MTPVRSPTSPRRVGIILTGVACAAALPGEDAAASEVEPDVPIGLLGGERPKLDAKHQVPLLRRTRRRAGRFD